ncbi:MAG: hypothetical protein NT010_10535, partial [Proteobacteria bacterium]|nr:hypothetical protein [Pseudomonadota bacterium]
TLRSFIIGNVGRKGLDIYPPLFMNGNFMQEGRQHEYDWCPLLTSGVSKCIYLRPSASGRPSEHK